MVRLQKEAESKRPQRIQQTPAFLGHGGYIKKLAPPSGF